MRIAYFNANLRFGQDGVTRVIYKMLDGALERGCEAIAVTSTLPNTEDQIVPMIKVPSVMLPLQKSYRIALPGFQHFAKPLLDFQPDILHINSPCTLGFGALRFARHYNIPIVATYHTHFPTYPRYYNLTQFENLAWRITRHLYNNMTRTFVPTMPILEELHQRNIKGLEYLPNGVDVNLFNPSHRSNEWRKRFGNGKKPIILFVSRLVWEKDLRVLAEMYRLLRSRRGDFEMVVVGDGHARQELETIMPGAHFLGYQTGTTLAESFASADIFVFPSTTETFGLVTLEAMASGIAPIAAKVGGAVEIIEEGKSGLFAQPFSGEDLAAKAELFLDHPQFCRAIASNAYQRAQSYRWGKILEQLFSSYTEIIESYKRTQFARVA